MKIAFITEYIEIGGGESNLLNLAQELNKSNTVTIFCSGKVKVEAEKRNIKTVEFNTRRRWIKFIPLICATSQLKNKLKGFDIVHAYSVNVLPLLVGLKNKIIWTTHGYWEKPNGLRAKVINRIVDKVVCVSTDVYNISEFLPSKKQTIFLGTNFIIEDSKEGQVFDRNNIKLVCIGRFQKIKGQDLLINALKELSTEQQHKKFHLTIVGDVNGKNKVDIEYKKSLYSQVENISNKNLKIIFVGFHSNVSDYIIKSDIVVIPSRYESFSMVAIEALSCAKPVIAPNIGGPKDIINSNSIGFLFESGSKVSLASTISDAIENYQDFNSEKAIERAKYFSIANQTKEHLKIYTEVLND